ncbi:hypothetical protein L7F22_011620, partial [Adiantum nelumboides]|nr:hypothetical protein [Adiantum nelumboides]
MERLVVSPQQQHFSTGFSHLSRQKQPLSKKHAHWCPTRLPFRRSTIVAESKAGLSYKDAGVDIDAGSELVRRIAAMAPGIGGFGGLFPL